MHRVVALAAQRNLQRVTLLLQVAQRAEARLAANRETELIELGDDHDRAQGNRLLVGAAAAHRHGQHAARIADRNVGLASRHGVHRVRRIAGEEADAPALVALGPKVDHDLLVEPLVGGH